MSFFFFQAEDGIRDGRVTGVQTCALPIFSRISQRDVDLAATVTALADELGLTGDVPRSEILEIAVDALDIPAVQPFWAAVMGYRASGAEERSEERRVGKEGRCRWAAYH